MTDPVKNFDRTDVPKAIKQETDDGPGDLENLPESDFQGFATEGVEVEEKEDSQ